MNCLGQEVAVADLFGGNPYLQDPRFALSPEQQQSYRLSQLATMLANLGAGIASTGATGQPRFAGIAPGAAAATRGVEKNNARMAQMLGKIGTGGVPGFNMQPSPVQLGPQAPNPNKLAELVLSSIGRGATLPAEKERQ
jgi:hypothetical protein